MKRLALLALVGALSPLPARGADVAPAFPVVDLSVHIPYRAVTLGHAVDDGRGRADVRRLRQGGAYGVVLPLVGSRRGDVRPTLEPTYRGVIGLLARRAELRMPGCRGAGSGIRTWLAIEGGDELASAPASVGLWTQRGVRLFGLVRDRDGALATSASTPAPVLEGLTPAGRDVVRRVFAAGAVVDVSHASEMTVRDVMELAREAGGRVVASHSGALALADHPQNVNDETISAIAASGGVVGIPFQPRALVRGHRADLNDVVRHVRHVVHVAGIDHVAIGSGFDGGFRPPPALWNASRYPRFTRALLDAGFSRAQVRKVASENALRVLCTPGGPSDARASGAPSAPRRARPAAGAE